MPGLTRYVERFNEDEKRILGVFFTNSDKSVFALKNLPEDTKAALFARYSRSSMSMRRLFLKEFVRDPETGEYYEGFEEHIGALEKASKFRVGGARAGKFMDVVFAQYGDDSVIDSASGHVALEGVDQVTAKKIEDGRLAGYIEKSSRYVDFTARLALDSEGLITGPAKNGGSFLYKEYPEIMYSSVAGTYTYTMDLLFNAVIDMHDAVSRQLRQATPIEEQLFEINVGGERRKVAFKDIASTNGIDAEKEEKKALAAYNVSIKAKTFDLTRGPLPASTMTNLGWHASFRSFDHSLIKMLASDFAPDAEAANFCYEELAALEPSLIKRVKGSHGMQEAEYLAGQKERLRALARDVTRGLRPRRTYDADLLHRDDDRQASLEVAAAALYPYTNVSMSQLEARLYELEGAGDRVVSRVIKASAEGRTNRRHKLPRAFENAQVMFEFEGNFGIFRDLQRNRFTLQERQKLTTANGYDMPPIIIDAGREGLFKDAMEASDALYKELVLRKPAYAETAVTFAHRVKWIATCDIRQAAWFLELRSGPQGHPDYRRRAQLAYKQLNETLPTLVNDTTMQFIDMNEYPLERLSAAHKTEEKLEALKPKRA